MSKKNSSTPGKTYKDIGAAVDKLLKKYPSGKVLKMLEDLYRSSSLNLNKGFDLIEIIITACIEAHGVSVERFKTSHSNRAINARSSCYFLIKKYNSDISYRSIANYFNVKNHGNIQRRIFKIKDVIDMPKINPQLFELHQKSEKLVISLIEKSHGQQNIHIREKK